MFNTSETVPDNKPDHVCRCITSSTKQSQSNTTMKEASQQKGKSVKLGNSSKMALLIMQICDLNDMLHTDPINAHIIIRLDTLSQAALCKMSHQWIWVNMWNSLWS